MAEIKLLHSENIPKEIMDLESLLYDIDEKYSQILHNVYNSVNGTNISFDTTII